MLARLWMLARAKIALGIDDHPRYWLMCRNWKPSIMWGTCDHLGLNYAFHLFDMPEMGLF